MGKRISRKVLLSLALGTLALVAACAGLLTFAVYEGDRVTSLSNLVFIEGALEQYEAKYGSLPPAYVPDASGKPAHSWRVLLLAFLDPELYAQYDFSEPWNGPINSKLVDQMPGKYRSPYKHFGHVTTSSYLVVTGDLTAWPAPHTTKTRELVDRSQTILVLQVENSDVCWMEPRDIKSECLSEKGRQNAQGECPVPQQFTFALFADISRMQLPKHLSDAALRDLVSNKAGKPMHRAWDTIVDQLTQ
jgi:hypothetical protein